MHRFLRSGACDGRLAVVRRSWSRGDTLLVQLAAVDSPLLLEARSESTLVVWISPAGRLIRRQWVREMRQSR